MVGEIVGVMVVGDIVGEVGSVVGGGDGLLDLSSCAKVLTVDELNPTDKLITTRNPRKTKH
jgi:hypothetical protein